MEKSSYRIIIADDNKMFLEALSAYLNKEERFDVIATCNSLDELSKISHYHAFDLLILDLSFNGINSIDSLDTIKPKGATFKILMLTTFNNPIIENEAYKKGVDYFIGKDFSFQLFPNRVIELLENEPKISTPKSFSIDFTPKQVQIIQALYEHTTEKEVAHHMNISVSTLKDHKQKLFVKTNSKNNIQLIKFAIKNKLIIV